jgi:hypothetical protein
MLVISTLQQKFPQRHHKVLEIDPARAKEGALLTRQAIPQGFIIDLLGVQG